MKGSPCDIDDVLPDRHKLGSTKPSNMMTVGDIELLTQALYLRDVIGTWHASLAQFIEGLLIIL